MKKVPRVDRQKLIYEIKNAYNISLNQCCRYLAVSKTTHYYEQKRVYNDTELKDYLIHLSTQHKRWGFDKMMSKIKLGNKVWNHKRVKRVYCELNLNLRIKPRKESHQEKRKH